ncbi:MAG: hypothetical protein MUC89_14180 [Acetobacteraceae bacterium]|jgi:hypothetical protein|nr:hypothetical protein [Acetobacteraceae bacterium]
MSSKAILLKRNPSDDAKHAALMALNPVQMVTYTATNAIPAAITVADTADYLLVTGGHGDFVASAPTKFNDLPVAMAKPWIASLKGDFHAIILDTCFSSAFAPSFLGHLEMGGYIVCAHGSGEGWAMGFDASDPNKTVGDALAGVVGSADGMGLGYSSISLLQRGDKGLRLLTANTGATRTAGLTAREGMGMDHDNAAELAQLDSYLGRFNILVQPIANAELQTRLRQALKMPVL